MDSEKWQKLQQKYRYKGREITVWWDGAKCNHNGNCLRTLSSVFDMKKNPWVDVDSDTPEEVARACDECPTGSLTYELVESNDG